MNLESALGDFCFYENKPRALSSFEVITSKNHSLFYALATLTAPYVKCLSLGGSSYFPLLSRKTAHFCNFHIQNSRKYSENKGCIFQWDEWIILAEGYQTGTCAD